MHGLGPVVDASGPVDSGPLDGTWRPEEPGGGKRRGDADDAGDKGSVRWWRGGGECWMMDDAKWMAPLLVGDAGFRVLLGEIPESRPV